MKHEIDAEVVSTPTDSRPEPGPFPDVFVCTYWWWFESSFSKHRWVTGQSGPHDSMDSATRSAQQHVRSGNRNVRIVRIPGDAAADRLSELSTPLETRFPPHKASLVLTHNDHKSVYQTVAEYDAEQQNRPDGATYTWASDDERAKAIATNEVWELHWYPDTPVGFYCIAASTLEAVLSATRADAAEGGQK